MRRFTRGGRLDAAAGVAPQVQSFFRDGREIGFLTVGVDGDKLLASGGAVNLVIPFARDLKRLDGGGFLERQRMLAVGVDYFDRSAVVLCGEVDLFAV